jgi:hypothetical protein
VIGNLVKIIRLRGMSSFGNSGLSPNEDSIFGVLQKMDAVGVTIYDEKRQTTVFVPMQHVVEIIDQGRRGS